jgi:hypothetical protein
MSNGILLCISIIALIIGFPCIIVGCNTKLGFCVNKNEYTGYVYKKETKKEVVTNSKSKTTSKCYNSYVYARQQQNGNVTTHTCRIKTCDCDENCGKRYSSATDKSNDYDYGEKVHWIKFKNTHSCETINKSLTIWYVGLAFLSFCCLLWIFIMIRIFYQYITNKYKNVQQAPDCLQQGSHININIEIV